MLRRYPDFTSLATNVNPVQSLGQTDVIGAERGRWPVHEVAADPYASGGMILPVQDLVVPRLLQGTI